MDRRVARRPGAVRADPAPPPAPKPARIPLATETAKNYLASELKEYKAASFSSLATIPLIPLPPNCDLG